MEAPFAGIETMIAEGTAALLSNVVVTPEHGEPFLGEMDSPDAEIFDVVTVPAYVLTYRTEAASLGNGSVLTINGNRYKVDGAPRRIGAGLFTVANLAKV